MGEKSPCNSRPIIGIEIIGGMKDKCQGTGCLITFTFHFPQQSSEAGSISSAGQMAEQGCKCQRQWEIQLLIKQKLLGTWSLILTV